MMTLTNLTDHPGDHVDPDNPGDPALTGSRLQKPRRVALLILFAFEVGNITHFYRNQHDK